MLHNIVFSVPSDNNLLQKHCYKIVVFILCIYYHQHLQCTNIALLSFYDDHTHLSFKVEYHANDSPFKNSEKIAYVGQRLMYPIIKINTLPRFKKKCH